MKHKFFGIDGQESNNNKDSWRFNLNSYQRFITEKEHHKFALLATPLVVNKKCLMKLLVPDEKEVIKNESCN